MAMKFRCAIFCLIIYFIIFSSLRVKSQPAFNRENLFDSGWRFHPGGAQGAEDPRFNDSQWRKLDLPHDWSIEDLPGTNSPFNINAISQVSGGFTTGGTGWYRKTFTVPDNLRGNRFRILFEGVYMNSEVWLNGHQIGNHPYGYSSFWFDVTDNLKFEGENVLSVKVRNEGENSRWYSGSGIYRHVWLLITDSVHIAQWGTSIKTSKVSEGEAFISVSTTLVNQSSIDKNIKLITRFYDKNSQELSKTESVKTLASGKSSEWTQEIVLKNPLLWSPDLPDLYKAVSVVYTDEKLVDKTETLFGIRSISFDPVNGFCLNGKRLKLKGGCVHHDNGPLGSRAYDRAEERRVELLKASGFNAIRCSHNPPSPAFLDACDRLGMLVMDEAFDMWNEPKNPNDYHLFFDRWWKKDVENMVLRDRNHPSVIMWSIGNEIPGRQRPDVVERAKTIGNFIREMDPTRPITSAVNDLNPDKDPYFATLDVAGYNYASGGDHNQESLYVQDHKRIPERIMVGTESYALEAFGSWMDVVDNPFVIGDFVWTAFDYIGEASIGWRGYWQKQDFFPWNLAYCGDIDICGWKRPQSYYRDALWKENQVSVWVIPPEPSFELNPDRQSWSKWHWYDMVDSWNWKGSEGKEMDVCVYSSCEQVELFLNGKSLGKKPINRSTKFTGVWKVSYQPGTLKALGYAGKKQVSVSDLKTAGDPVRIKLIADRQKVKADGEDLSYVTVELTDANGIRNPEAENLIAFSIDGPGTIVAVGNANPVSIESYQLTQRKAWRGRCLVIVKSDTKAGPIILKVTAPGLNPASIEINSI
jgi:beta-galactosidase